MMRTARRSPSRTRSRSTIPGLRRCKTCGHIYTHSAMVCPNCHSYGPLAASNFSRSPCLLVSREASPSLQVSPPAPTYPTWVYATSLEMNRRGYDTSRLSTVLDKMIDDRAPAHVRDVVRAVLYYRYGAPLPILDPNAEQEANRWLQPAPTTTGDRP